MIEDFDEQLIVSENNKALELFKKTLKQEGLTKKTIDKHLSNVNTFLDYYLLGYSRKSFKDGCKEVSFYLGDFFIEKCMWATPNSIKTTAASIKKFYKCMLDNNLVELDDFLWLCTAIKEKMHSWQKECYQFNNTDEDFF